MLLHRGLTQSPSPPGFRVLILTPKEGRGGGEGEQLSNTSESYIATEDLNSLNT